MIPLTLDAIGFVSTPTNDVEPRIDFFLAILHSPAVDDITYGLWVAAVLGTVAGLVLRRWWHGVIAIPLITAAYVTFLLLIPVFAFGESFELPALGEIARVAREVFVGLIAVFVLTFSLRWIAVRVWRWIVSQPRSA